MMNQLSIYSIFTKKAFVHAAAYRFEVWAQMGVSASDLISQITKTHNISDLTVEEPDIEGIISRIYQEGYHHVPL